MPGRGQKIAKTTSGSGVVEHPIQGVVSFRQKKSFRVGAEGNCKESVSRGEDGWWNERGHVFANSTESRAPIRLNQLSWWEREQNGVQRLSPGRDGIPCRRVTSIASDGESSLPLVDDDDEALLLRRGRPLPRERRRPAPSRAVVAGARRIEAGLAEHRADYIASKCRLSPLLGK